MADIDTWMPWHVAEYLADTMHLSTLEHGAYLLLLAHGWRNDGMIAVNERVLAGVTRLTVDQWRTVKPTLERFFTSTDHPTLGPCWFQKRQVEEIRKAKEVHAKAVERTKKATAARWPSVTDSSRIPQGDRNAYTREVKVEVSSDPGNSARALEPDRLHVRNVLANVDPGNLLPAPADPPNIDATRQAITPKDEFWAPLCRIFDLEPKTISDEQRLYDQCIDFRAKGSTVEEIERRKANYHLWYPGTACTPRAILNNWDVCKNKPEAASTNGAPKKKTRVQL